MQPNAYSIRQLIPQRPPIVMVDELLRVEGDDAVCSLTVRKDNYFIEPDSHMAEVGLIEHIAQSASAFAGFRAIETGAKTPPIGYIGEVKHFRISRRPAVGDTLLTTISMGPEVQGVTIIHGRTMCSDITIAETQMKIFINS